MSDEVIKFTADVIATNVYGEVLLIKRLYDPFAGCWALPGGHVDRGELAYQAAIRELKEETGVEVPMKDLRFVSLGDRPDRDPRGRYVSAVFSVRVPYETVPVAGDDAVEARFWPMNALPSLAFDHGEILAEMFFTEVQART